MNISIAGAAVLALATLVLPASTLAAIRLVPVATGLSSPLFVGNAGDNSHRLFIVERPGVIRVLQPGGTTPTTFLDIRTRIVSGGERGLLGLAFHPQYISNARFFVFYTRTGDGALVIAEYRASVDPNVADPAEAVLLVIPHPGNTNHNGGMLAFGRDGFLYIGVGDGGGSNDPPNNAQNINVLLGKILRIDIDPPAGSGVAYLSPPTNPFHGVTPGRDEIFAFGMRNPWRFSFDRVTGQQWVGDVGQGAREEVDTPIVAGGNYGWRVYEGFRCTDLDTSLCQPGNYILPAFEYAHTSGRCSLTGGYAYRGAQLVVRDGNYLFADYCTGEIFDWDGATQTLLLDTTMNISSFGEDEDGELYVVDLNGSVSQIVKVAPCAFQIAPGGEAFAATGGTASATVVTATGCDWSSVANDPWIHVTSGATGRGPGTVTYVVDANPSSSPRTGSLTIADGGQQFIVSQSGVAAGCTSATPARLVVCADPGRGQTAPRSGQAPRPSATRRPWCCVRSPRSR